MRVMDNKHFDERVKLGLNIKYYRMLSGFTQEQLAEAANISKEHISKIERAASSVSIEVLFEVSEVLQVPIHKFFEFRE